MSPSKLLEGLFYLVMRNIVIILSILLVLFSCGNETASDVKNDVNGVVDSTSTEQEKEFKAINTMLKADINNTALYLKRAKLYTKYGELDLAIKDIDRAISLDSLVPDYYLLKAELYRRQDKYKKAKETLDACMLVDNENIPARLELGWLALIVRDYKQGLDYADAVLKRDIHNAEAYYLKGMIFQEKNDTDLALSSFSTAIEQENDYYEALIGLGILNMKRDVSLSKEYLKNALKLRPQSLEALYAYAMCCQEKGDYNEAIETYHDILKIEEYREPYFNLGFIHQEYLKVYDVAIDYYSKAIEVEPKYIDAYYNRALCYEQRDEKAKAEKDLREALRLNPQYTSAALALERVLGE